MGALHSQSGRAFPAATARRRLRRNRLQIDTRGGTALAGHERRRYFVKAGEVPGYHPANHTGTTNHRLIGADTVGARQVEVMLGVIEKGKGALPHAHPGIEQVCYLLEGEARAEVGGEAAS